MDLENYRKEIDEIDSRILELLGQRREVALKVGQYKRAQGIAIYAPEREKELLESKVVLAEKYSLSKSFVQKVFQEIVEYCRGVQQ